MVSGVQRGLLSLCRTKTVGEEEQDSRKNCKYDDGAFHVILFLLQYSNIRATHHRG